MATGDEDHTLGVAHGVDDERVIRIRYHSHRPAVTQSLVPTLHKVTDLRVAIELISRQVHHYHHLWR
jgi:hypothetical protein